MDELISRLFEELQVDEETVELSAEAYRQRNAANDTYTDSAKESLLEELKLLDTKESTLVDGYTSLLIKKPLFEEEMRQIENDRVVLKNQLQEIDKKGPLTDSTFEQIKNVFQQGNTASKEYIEARDEYKRRLLEKLLSNLTIKDGNVASFKFKSEYQVLANTPKNASVLQLRRVRDSNP